MRGSSSKLLQTQGNTKQMVPGREKKQRQKNNAKTILHPSLEIFGTLILTHSSCSWEERLYSELDFRQPGQHLCTPEPQKTKQMPTSAFLMQLIVMLLWAGVQLDSSHMHREISTSGLMNYPSTLHWVPAGSSATSERGLFPFQISIVPFGQLTIRT